MTVHHLPRCCWVVLLCLLPANLVHSADWPTYRGDVARTGGAEETLPLPLFEAWTFTSPAPPEMAWSSGEGRVIEGKQLGNRVKFDDVFHPVAADGRLFFGSTADDQLHCLDLASGKTLWTFFTGAPIRLAPSIVDQRVYFGSDDGHVYCLDAATGELQWDFLAGPKEDWLLGRGEMISRWPVRTGVLVDGGVAYFGAGIFPHESIFLHAVNANDGTPIWRQDNLSVQDAGRNDLSPQGYLLASEDLLFVPSGRSLPAAFDRKTGEFVHKRTHSWRSTAGGVVGGVGALLADGQIYSEGPHHLLAMSQEKGDVGYGWIEGKQMAVLGDDAYIVTGEWAARLNRTEYAVNSRTRHTLELRAEALSRQLRGEKDKAKSAEIRKQLDDVQQQLADIADVGVVWRKDATDETALLATPNFVVLGGKGRVQALSADKGALLWEAKVMGDARGLAIADGHLIVSTNYGVIHVFSPIAKTPAVANAPRSEVATDVFETKPVYQQAAEQILSATGVRRGFCLVIDGNEGELAYELAKRSQLEVYLVESDPDKVSKARANLARAGIYGNRVTVHPFDAANLPYANYFANLIVSDAMVATGSSPTDPALVARCLKPAGGVMCWGTPAGDHAEQAQQILAAVARSADLGNDQTTLTTDRGWATITRTMLPGAGSWSHQYGNPANTAVSNDRRVKGGLGVLWYGDPSIADMVNRHDGAVGPLAAGGRLFVQGESTIRAYDAYNGLFLWNYDNPQGIRTGVYMNVAPGNLAASEDRLFHFIEEECFELDAATGRTIRVHHLPESQADGKHQWSYVAVQDGLLFGAATIRNSIAARARRRGQRTDEPTDGVFAIDIATGQHLWDYAGHSISHRTIALGPDRVFFIDSTITSEQRAAILRQDKSHLQDLTGKEREIAEDRLKKADLRRAVALDARSGKQLWAQPVDVTDCSDIGIGGGMLTLMYQNNTLILCGANANGHYWRQFVAGEFSRRRLVALSATGGYKLWAKDANYRHRPIIVGQQVLAEPWMYDLQTGKQLTREHPITGEEVAWSMMRTGHHCGMLTACDSGMVLFRSGYTGFMDLNQDAGVRHFAGHRTGCWINAIPANGLVMIPEASAGCVCLFSIASTIVLEPREAEHAWAIYSAVGAKTPVRHLALNLGAPGDRKDDSGAVWLSYPRYKAYQETSLDVKLDLQPQFAAGKANYQSVQENTPGASQAETPWLYTSWAEGLKEIVLPLLGEQDQPAAFDVELHFADLRAGDHQQPVFDVQFNDETVLENVALRPGEPLLETIHGVSIQSDLTIKLVAKQGDAILNAVRVVRAEE